MKLELPPEPNIITEMMTHLHSSFHDYNPTSQVAKFYTGKSIFITGGTGFIGKVLIEKLVRSCRDIKRIYLLVREKKGKSVEERLQDLLEAHVFNRIKADRDGTKLLREKLRAIQGDITLPKFGINPDDLEELADEVEVVFNSAATIRFVEPIDVAVRNNISSVDELINFCNELRNLRALVHLSTAYSNCHKRDTIYEIFYEPPMRGDQIISATRALKKVSEQIHSYPHKEVGRDNFADVDPGLKRNSSGGARDSQANNGQLDRDRCEQQVFYHGKPIPSPESLLNILTEISLKQSNRPNTYTFTKAISESHLLDLVTARRDRYLHDKVPVAVIRPSIVGGAWREPDVGEVDNFNGPTGAILSLYTGALQAMPGVGERIADMVPVDMVVNMVICSAWFLLNKNDEARTKNLRPIKQDCGVYVFNFVSGYRNPLRWHQVTDLIRELSYKYPSKFLVRLPSSYFIRAGKVYDLYDWFNHKLPAILQDFIRAKILRQELTPRTSAVFAYNRIRQMTETLTPFTSNQWRLCDDNVCALGERLSPVDKELFEFDVAKINWNEYIRNFIIGARIYTLKDVPKNVPGALKALKMRQRVNRGLVFMTVLLLYFLFCRQPQLEAAALELVGQLLASD